MSFDHGFDEKIDVIDLIINVLKEHEKKLDELVSRLEELPKIPTQPSSYQEPEKAPVRELSTVGVSAILKKWSDFRERSNKAKLVAFALGNTTFKVSALSRGVVYIYEEEMPQMNIKYSKGDEGAQIESIEITETEIIRSALRGSLECGLELKKRDTKIELPNGSIMHKILFDIEPGVAKSWIAYQLNVEEEIVVIGELKV